MTAQPKMIPVGELSYFIPAIPSFVIPDDLDQAVREQLRYAEQCLLERPDRKKTALKIYHLRPVERGLSRLRPDSIWPLLCDPAIPLRFDSQTEVALEERCHPTQINNDIPRPDHNILNSELGDDPSKQRYENLLFFLERVSDVQQARRDMNATQLGSVSLQANE